MTIFAHLTLQLGDGNHDRTKKGSAPTMELRELGVHIERRGGHRRASES